MSRQMTKLMPWVGGKAQLMWAIQMLLPTHYKTLVDVFGGSGMPDTPGLAVWKSGHIGVYIGNGEVIEAMDTRYGVVKTKLQGRGWTHWLEVPGIKYD